MMIVMQYIVEMEMLRLAASVKVKKTVRRSRGGKTKRTVSGRRSHR